MLNFNGTRPAAVPLISNGRAFKFTTGSLYAVGVDEIGPVSDAFALEQNYPNPFNATTQIRFTLPTRRHVAIEIFNVLGQRIAILADADFEAGNHAVTWEATDAKSGIYFYRIGASEQTVTRRMILLK
jgi:hypothetical protein